MAVLNVNNKEKKILLKNLQRLYAETVEEKKQRVALIKKIEKSMQQIKPRSAKNKGAAFQKEICGLIADILGIEFNNADDNCEIHSREMGLSGADVVVRGDARKRFGYGIECKNSNAISLPAWVRQAKENAIDGQWLLFIKSALLESGPVVVMPLDEFEELARYYQGARK